MGLKALNKWGPISGSPLVNVSRVGGSASQPLSVHILPPPSHSYRLNCLKVAKTHNFPPSALIFLTPWWPIEKSDHDISSGLA